MSLRWNVSAFSGDVVLEYYVLVVLRCLLGPAGYVYMQLSGVISKFAPSCWCACMR